MSSADRGSYRDILWWQGTIHPAPCGQTLEISGQAWMHGIVMGEAVQDWKQGKYATENFIIFEEYRSRLGRLWDVLLESQDVKNFVTVSMDTAIRVNWSS
jgi:hypothetical protein